MAVFKLVIAVQSPAVAAAVLLACALPPFIIIAVHFAKQYAEMVFMRDVEPTVPSPAGPPRVV